MTNNKQSSVDWLIDTMYRSAGLDQHQIDLIIEQAKAMQKQQAEHYATFITNCVNNNLPTITFNDWINLGNNEQQ